MYSMSTIIISILNVKQVKVYFIVIFSVNNKKYEYNKHYVQASHVTKCQKIV